MQNLQETPILLFYSEYSEKCNKLSQLIPKQFLTLFKTICVDSAEIRNILKNSTNIEINTVPCFLNISPEGNVAKYEGKDAFAWINEYIKSLETPTPPPTSFKPSQGLPVSSVADLLQFNKHDQSPPPQQDLPLAGLQARYPDSIDILPVEPDLGRTKRGPSKRFQSISSNRDVDNKNTNNWDRDQRYDHHEASNDISEYYPTEKSKKAIMIEDLSPQEDYDDEEDNNLLDDPSGMGIPRTEVITTGGSDTGSNRKQPPPTVTPTGSNKKTEKSQSIKLMAAAIAAAREDDTSNTISAGQAPARVLKESSKQVRINM
jgi:hypothetical protein